MKSSTGLEIEESLNPNKRVLCFNHDASELDLIDAIDKRLNQADALAMVAMNCEEEYVFQKGTGNNSWWLLQDLIKEIRFFHKILQKKRSNNKDPQTTTN